MRISNVSEYRFNSFLPFPVFDVATFEPALSAQLRHRYYFEDSSEKRMIEEHQSKEADEIRMEELEKMKECRRVLEIGLKSGHVTAGVFPEFSQSIAQRSAQRLKFFPRMRVLTTHQLYDRAGQRESHQYVARAKEHVLWVGCNLISSPFSLF